MIVPETLEKIASAAASLGELNEDALASLKQGLAGSALHFVQRRRYARALAGCIEARQDSICIWSAAANIASA